MIGCGSLKVTELAGDRNRTRSQASCLPAHRATLFITLLTRMLLVAGTKITNHSSSSQKGSVLAPITAAARVKDGRRHIQSQSCKQCG